MSDQDFFFDEEDEKPARTEKAQPSKPSGGKAPAPKASPTAASNATAGTFFQQDLNMGVAALMVVIALLLGVLVGIFVGESRANSALIGVPGVTSPDGGTNAPPLSQDQLNSGQLPAGHPSLGASGSVDATK